MKQNWKRPKTLYSKTEDISTNCGNIHIVFSYIEPEFEHLVEVMASIGKGGTCPSVCLDTCCKFISIFLQGALSKTKMVKKLRKNFLSTTKLDSVNCGQPFNHNDKQYSCCIEHIIEKIVKELI